MAHEVPWTKVILEEFAEQALLTETEEKILRTRIAGWSRTRQAYEFNMSIATVDKIISRLKKKYDAVQKYDAILPPRTHGKKNTENFMGY